VNGANQSSHVAEVVQVVIHLLAQCTILLRHLRQIFCTQTAFNVVSTQPRDDRYHGAINVSTNRSSYGSASHITQQNLNAGNIHIAIELSMALIKR